MDKKNNKIIHYIWFGGNPISDLTKKCIQTWKKYLPDFEIKEWNETNFDVNQCPFVKQAYEQKKWAFVADYTRFKVLEEYGGMYLDTDMEITADISKYLEHDLFMGQEDSKMINAAVVWAKEAHNPHIKNILNIYESKKVFNETGDLYDQSVPRVLTTYFEQYGFNKELDKVQVLDEGRIHLYPMEYFYPLSYDYQHNRFTDNSCMIHHFDATWISKMEKFKTKMKRKNMKWVVHIIDFFINVKNKIKFFSNYRDITIFATMFFILLFAMFSVTPIETANLKLGMFSMLIGNTFSSVIQIFVLSCAWTFIMAKARNIDLNFYGDRMTNTDSNSGEYRKVKLNLEQITALNNRERLIYIVQILVTILVSFLPVLELLTIIPSSLMIYTFLSMINLYYIYLGIKKEFTFRILELIPFAIVLALMMIVAPTYGLLTSLVTFAFILYNLFANKIKRKRIIAFSLSYVIGIVLCLILNYSIPGINKFNNINVGTTITSTISNEYSSYINEEEKITEFNAGKEVYAKNIKNMLKDYSFTLSPSIYAVISILLVGVLTFITKNKNYLFIGLMAILNYVYIMGSDIKLSLLIGVITCSILIVLVIENLIDRVSSED